MPTYETPKVYIEELTGPGVIAGVGTSTAAFIGPAAKGPLCLPKPITTFDEFRRTFGRASDEWPYLVFSGRRFYLGHAVQGFFENGGGRAYIVRVGTAKNATWRVEDSASSPAEVFRLEAQAEGIAANEYKISVSQSVAPASAPTLAYSKATITSMNASSKQISVDYGAAKIHFVPGDTVELAKGSATWRNRIVAVSESASGPVLTLESPLTGTPNSVRMAAIDAEQLRFRVTAPSRSIQAGSIIRVPAKAALEKSLFSVVERTDANGFVYLRVPFQEKNGDALASPIDISSSPTLQILDFDLTIEGPDGKETQRGLSLDPFHSGYIFQRTFKAVRVVAPTTPPATVIVSQLVVASSSTLTLIQKGQDDNPSGVSLDDYKRALDKLEDFDDVSIVCVPDAATLADKEQSVVQRAVIDHCSKEGVKDRIAVLDVPRGLPPAGDWSATSHRDLVANASGFAALYYPWLMVPEPLEPGMLRSAVPRSILVPPSGHIAGVYARNDQDVGVHNAPANTEVKGVMGLERVISDREQALINPKGVNALRIFPGDGRVLVWGARTTVPQEGSDWTYVNVRRLMLYIEESIEKGIRWALFKPNDRSLWQSLKRTISDFLERVWRDGGLAGAREQAYQVRIDEGLNPPADIAKGRLHIEVKVAPVRPAEFIIVRIGLWDGGAEVVET